MQSTEVQSQRVGIIGTIKLAERLAQPLPTSSSQPGPHGGFPLQTTLTHAIAYTLPSVMWPRLPALLRLLCQVRQLACLLLAALRSCVSTFRLCTLDMLEGSVQHMHLPKQQEVTQQCQASWAASWLSHFSMSLHLVDKHNSIQWHIHDSCHRQLAS